MAEALGMTVRLDLGQFGIPSAVIAVFIFILGLIFGSFFNVVIYRLPKKEPISRGRSHCPACGTQIKEYDLVPLFSYIFLMGRCRACKTRISPVYPAVELLTGLIFAGLYLYPAYGFSFLSLGYAMLLSCTLIAAFIDAKTREIPNSLIIVMIVLGIVHALLNNEVIWWERLAGIAAGGFPLLLAFILSRGGMGGADMKLMAAAGIFLGWKLVLVALFAGLILGAIGGVITMAVKKTGRKTVIPFGPYLGVGILVSVFAGSFIIQWYSTILGLS
ncbi:MAG: prepilin peptidase [Bacillota bacterium]|nr:prepilin peptidase [Bacillota bacterium]